MPYTTSSCGGRENCPNNVDWITAHALRANHYTYLALLSEVSHVSTSKNRSITLRDFLLKSTAKLQTFPDMAK